jgi:hypothetical protein
VETRIARFMHPRPYWIDVSLIVLAPGERRLPILRIESLDREARRLGVTRQFIIKLWIAERLERGRTAA